MSKIYSYADYFKIARVGDEVRAVPGKYNPCGELHGDGSNTQLITKVSEASFEINGCRHEDDDDGDYLELVNPAQPTWDTLAVGDEIQDPSGDRARVLAVLGDVFLRSMWNDPESVQDWITKKEAQEYSLTLVTPPSEPDIQEMTVEEVSKLVGKKVKIVE